VNLASLAWRLAPRLPGAVARALFALAADAAWFRRGKGVRQLEANLRRVLPGASKAALRRVSRQGMRRYLRYYCEAFQLAGWSEAQVDAMVAFEVEVEVEAEVEVESAAAAGAGGGAGPEPKPGSAAWAGRGSVLAGVEGREGLVLGQGRQAVLALAHMGNWDLAGAWATRHLAPVVSVAERLKPEAAFQDFLRLRQAIGLEIIPLEAGKPAFPQLLQALAGREAWLAPLLAERDLGRGGVEVDFFGEKALVAAGPAALALATGRPLAPVAMWLSQGGRKRPAYTLRFGRPVPAPGGVTRAEQIQTMTQAWVGWLEEQIRRHPADWHMLQKVFLRDLDPGRLERARGRAGQADGGGGG
jgi:KDO2-lipid IV(A) lauroyltransferase